MGMFTLASISVNSLPSQWEVLCMSDKNLSTSEGVGQGTLFTHVCTHVLKCALDFIWSVQYRRFTLVLLLLLQNVIILLYYNII